MPEYTGTARDHLEKHYATRVHPTQDATAWKERKEKAYRKFIEGKIMKRRTREDTGNLSQF